MESNNLYGRILNGARAVIPARAVSALVILGLIVTTFAIGNAQGLLFNEKGKRPSRDQGTEIGTEYKTGGLVLADHTSDILTPCGDLSFTQAPGSPFAATSPLISATADFNGDGNPDLAATDNVNNAVRIYLGDGNGGFTTATPVIFGPGPPPVGIIAADFNLDGKIDLAVTISGGSTVAILIGDGHGGFSSTFGANVTGAYLLVSADFNLDGKPDLAVGGGSGNPVSVLLGDGHGNFSLASGSPLSVPSSFGLTVGDFNLDGKPDLAVATLHSSSAYIFLGNGSGGFSPAPGSPIAIAGTPDFFATADFNGDGKPDLAVSNNGSQGMTILLGNGNGSFTPAPGSPIAIGSELGQVVAADFNLDGKPDLASIRNSSNDVTILLGDGAGGFPPSSVTTVTVADAPVWLAIADFNRDGRPDFAASDTFINKISVELNTCSPATITIDGRLLSPDLRGLRNAVVTMTDQNGNSLSATTSSFGYFSFVNVPAGQTNTLRVSSRLYRFQPQTVTANTNLTLPDLVGQE